MSIRDLIGEATEYDKKLELDVTQDVTQDVCLLYTSDAADE